MFQSARCIVVIASLVAVRSLVVQTSSAGDPCPFGYGCGGSDSISPATRDEVGRILSGILKQLSSKKGLVQEKRVVHKAVAADVSQAAAPPAEATVQSLRRFVGLLKQNSKQRTAATVIAHMIASDMPVDYGCKYFGACDDAATAQKPIDAQTKAEVASILEGILANLSKHK
eukprot:TRINITY_DN31352_c0_g1_i1.p1 TRINITY_DN31352_c0_g1~~TRINITY_DN31352_c0_g1_i1.p1  ORF type:complete len:172 (+),score=44.87 TRINITY_DN31352_c0_g1_i1:75-590(+)